MHMSEVDLELKKLQAIELAMLKECIRICDKHNIRYFLLGGSALGAVRHSGFIPWDDDIDIGMPRPDYEKFLSLSQKEFNADLFLQTHETDPSYPMSYAKIRNSKTTFIQSIVAHLYMNHGVYIDIFPLDGYPRNKVLGKIHMLVFKTYRASILHKLGVKHRLLITHILVSAYAAFFSQRCLREKAEKLMKKNSYDNSDVIINWGGTWGMKEAVPKSFFGEGRRTAFEEITVTIPDNYDGYLSSLYGDYMTPPPIEKRISQHFTDFIDLHNSYTKYMGNK